MGKSGGRKKKGGGVSQAQNQVSGEDNHSPPVVVNGGVNLDSSVFLKRAHELKEEGNRRFQAKDYVGALLQYENALKLTPKTHPDRAVFHSNRAACLMQMKPIDYETVISECNLALQVQPSFVRALLRRARAFEAIGKYEMAMQDVQLLLVADPNHGDALEIAGRLRMALGPPQEAQQDLQSRPSPAALGASAIRGAPIAGLGPCLPARPVAKKPASSVAGANVPSNKSEKLYPMPPIENGTETKIQLPRVVLKPSNGSSRSNLNGSKDNLKEQLPSQSVLHSVHRQSAEPIIQYRPLKLVYDHDIRLAQMPVNCSLKVLRDVVSKRFPMSKAVLIKYKDSDGDLVTVTCSAELRLAESSVDNLIPKDPDTEKGESPAMLKLHIVEVCPEQEPPLLEEEEESVVVKGDENVSQSSAADSAGEAVESEIDNTEKVIQKEKTGGTEDPECKEVEMDDWLFEFAQLFRTHVGIDPDAHIDLHELGMELCSEALEETVTSEEAQSLFDKAALKFQEVVALAFFNWGNVHMCAARKRMPIDESADKETMNGQLQDAYDWVKEKYTLAKEKYEEALLIKPDFYEGLLALGQQQFEMAKLHWSFILAKKEELSKWDPTETIGLFDSAEEKMKTATAMWEKLEEQRANELKDPSSNKKDELLKRKKKQGIGAQSESGVGETTPEEAAEQAAVMRSQIHLFWGNMLFERSQIECKLSLPGWKKNLDAAVERFKLAGASEADISTVLKNHCSNEEAADGNEKKVEDMPTDDVVKQ
ncbi:Octicosapeptide/Phox/Bem1p domain-containing protein / tetratricopeptide repeat protein [Perilla frutescens var. frutescens]|nr:Octicosapeptide/Phox/Bem1p domain-containing protein / tetratricopeptide repeat protein [Perilla frutescens var. frutescens]